jgi:hypothetical protein
MKLSPVQITTGLLLWGVFFLELGVFFALGILLSAALLYIAIAENARIDSIGVVLLANIAYWLASAFAVDAIDLRDFLSPRFYGGEGRIFISLLPLAALCLVSVGSFEMRATIRQLFTIGAASIALFLIWMATGTTLLSGPGHPDEFHGFLTSHTGSGTFFGCIAIFTIVYSAEKRSRKVHALSLLLLGPVFASGSREAMVGVLAALAWYWVLCRPHPRLLIGALVVALAMIPVVANLSNKAYNRTIAMLSWDTVESIVDQAKYGVRSDWAVGDWTPDGDTAKLESGDVTTLVRVMLWVYAGKRFLDSPVFGMGWGRFNDRSLVMLDASPVLAVATSGDKVFSTSNAHNSYFQLLSESGLLGIALYLGMWLMLYRRCGKAARVFHPVQSLRAYYFACQGLIIYILACALTGHALASPSVMVPVVTVVGIGIAYYRSALGVLPATRPALAEGAR